MSRSQLLPVCGRVPWEQATSSDTFLFSSHSLGNHPPEYSPDREIREILEVHSTGLNLEIVGMIREFCLQSFLPRDDLVLDTHICPRNPHVICVVRDPLVSGARVESNKPSQLIIFALKFSRPLKNCRAAISSIAVRTAALILPALVRRNVRKFRLQQGIKDIPMVYQQFAPLSTTR